MTVRSFIRSLCFAFRYCFLTFFPTSSFFGFHIHLILLFITCVRLSFSYFILCYFFLSSFVLYVVFYLFLSSAVAAAAASLFFCCSYCRRLLLFPSVVFVYSFLSFAVLLFFFHNFYFICFRVNMLCVFFFILLLFSSPLPFHEIKNCEHKETLHNNTQQSPMLHKTPLSFSILFLFLTRSMDLCLQPKR